MLSGSTRLLALLGSLLLLCSIASAQFVSLRRREKPRYRVPEPSVLALAGAGAVGIVGAIRRKTRT
ncbi:MAG TPA: PEP-CTERM sorting domain-containing protein [Terriglobales bacterium]|jgi:hypothetical protein